MNDLTKLKVGDPVYTADGETGKITRQIDPAENDYPVRIAFGRREADLTKDGRYLKNLPIDFYAQPPRLAQTGTCDFSQYKVDDFVYLIDDSRAVVTKVEDGFFSTGGHCRLPVNGKDCKGRQVYYHAPPRFEPTNPDAFKVPKHIADRAKEFDWSQVPIDTLVWAIDGIFKQKRYFAGVKNGKPHVWADGATSETTEDSLVPDRVVIIC